MTDTKTDHKAIRVCALCKYDINVTKRCGKCKAVYYCSITCQKKHWSQHKVTCVPKPSETLNKLLNHIEARESEHIQTVFGPNVTAQQVKEKTVKPVQKLLDFFKEKMDTKHNLDWLNMKSIDELSLRMKNASFEEKNAVEDYCKDNREFDRKYAVFVQIIVAMSEQQEIDFTEINTHLMSNSTPTTTVTLS